MPIRHSSNIWFSVDLVSSLRGILARFTLLDIVRSEDHKWQNVLKIGAGGGVLRLSGQSARPGVVFAELVQQRPEAGVVVEEL